jgi:hypothetical protein
MDQMLHRLVDVGLVVAADGIDSEHTAHFYLAAAAADSDSAERHHPLKTSKADQRTNHTPSSDD